MALLSTSASVRFNSRSSGDRLSVVVSGLVFRSSCSVDVKKAGLKYEVPRSKSSQVNTAPYPRSLSLAMVQHEKAKNHDMAVGYLEDCQNWDATLAPYYI